MARASPSELGQKGLDPALFLPPFHQTTRTASSSRSPCWLLIHDLKGSRTLGVAGVGHQASSGSRGGWQGSAGEPSQAGPLITQPCLPSIHPSFPPTLQSRKADHFHPVCRATAKTQSVSTFQLAISNNIVNDACSNLAVRPPLPYLRFFAFRSDADVELVVWEGRLARTSALDGPTWTAPRPTSSPPTSASPPFPVPTLSPRPEN